MKGWGTLLILWGAGGCYLLRRRQAMLPVRIGQALLQDLAVLRFLICTRRVSLPALLETTFTDGAGADALWRPLAAALDDAWETGESLPACWERTAAGLPEPLGRILAPLGPLLPEGGERLAGAIEETREELTVYLRTERERQAQEGRLTAGMCLAGACLLILVLI